MTTAVILDLDDTLYDESTYVASGLFAVAEYISNQYGASAQMVYKIMQEDIRRSGRGTAFNAALRGIGQSDSRSAVDALVQIYRTHSPAIDLYPDAKTFLDGIAALTPGVKAALVTDGLPLMQRRKVEALGIASRFCELIYCWEVAAPKPSINGFLRAALRMRMKPQHCVMIGDRVDHDMCPAKALGMHTIRIARGRYAQDAAPANTVDVTFQDFDPVLDYLHSRKLFTH